MEKVKIIQDRLKIAQSRNKFYSYVRRRDFEFEEDDWVYLCFHPWRVVWRFARKWKLNPQYVSPYRISKKIDNVAHEF